MSRVDAGIGAVGSGQASARNDLAAAQRGGAEKAVIAHLVNPGRRDQDSQPLEQLQRLVDHMSGPVAPAALEAVQEAAVRKE